MAEQERLPAGFLERLIEYRRYAEAKTTMVDRELTPEARQAIRGMPLYALAERIHYYLEGILSEI